MEEGGYKNKDTDVGRSAQNIVKAEKEQAAWNNVSFKLPHFSGQEQIFKAAFYWFTLAYTGTHQTPFLLLAMACALQLCFLGELCYCSCLSRIPGPSQHTLSLHFCNFNFLGSHSILPSPPLLSFFNLPFPLDWIYTVRKKVGGDEVSELVRSLRLECVSVQFSGQVF